MIDAQQFSDETIRRFLLGSLNSAEQSALEHSLFVNAELEERVRLAELDMSDDYSANRLSAAERELFRQRFLLTANRKNELEVSAALHSNFAGVGVRTHHFWWQPVVNFFDVRRHAWKYAFAALTLMLLLLATALLVKKERSRLAADPGIPHRTVPRPSPTSLPQSAHHPSNPSAPAHTESSPALPSHDELTNSVVLESGTSLESAPTISMGGDHATIQLIVGEPFANSYEVLVTTVSGESVFAGEGLNRTEERTLSFDVPASSIRPGDFQITLTRVDGESRQSAGTYYFRVR
jgi:hypothetical protein